MTVAEAPLLVVPTTKPRTIDLPYRLRKLCRCWRERRLASHRNGGLHGRGKGRRANMHAVSATAFSAGNEVKAGLHAALLPRLVCCRGAPRYPGMDRNRFDAALRRSLPRIRTGLQGVAFDRLERDA